MADSDFVEVGTAGLSNTGKSLALKIYLLGAPLFIDLERIKGIIEKGENAAPIWIQRYRYDEVKNRRRKR